jgi:hypothetical protein
MESSFHILTPFFQLFGNCQFRKLDPIQFLCFQYHILAGWRLEIRLDSTEVFFITTQKTQPLYCWEGVCTAPLHSSESYSIVACVFVAAGMCSPSRCLEINVYSEITISAFGRHVSIRFDISTRNRQHKQ